MEQETIRALTMKDCVLDRSWMTDVIYSRAHGRLPGSSRSDIYRYGLLAARYCVMYLQLSPGVVEKGLNQEMDGIRRLYEAGHWSIPERAFIQYSEKPTLGEVAEMKQEYLQRAAELDACPSPGLGSAVACDILIHGCFFNDLVADLMLCSGVRPDQVHIAEGLIDTDFSDYLEEYFKPKMYVNFSKYNLKHENFEECVGRFQKGLQEAGIKFAEKGLEEYTLT